MCEENHIVKRAIIMAAGFGNRMYPLTLTTPKPLVKVNGVRMIDTVVDGLRSNGITEIYVVVGHLKEQFYEWAAERQAEWAAERQAEWAAERQAEWAKGQSVENAKEQPGVQIIENPDYATCNNISSLYVAREHLGECIILDGDQIIYNKEILDPHFTLSGYNAVWCEGETKEWLMEVEDGVVKSCSRTGGRHGWQLYSISRWTAEDGAKLRRHLEQEFEGGNRQIFWDDVVMFCHFNEYRLGIREMQAEDIIEIDGIDELAQADPSYRTYLDSLDE